MDPEDVAAAQKALAAQQGQGSPTPVQPQAMAPQQVNNTPAAPSQGAPPGQGVANAAAQGVGGGKGLTGMASSFIQALPGLIAASDERVKKNVADTGRPVQSFLDKLHAHEYQYKNPGAPGQAPGTHVSVMAQELEKAGPVGKQMVEDTPNGKMVNYGRGLAAMLASQADLHHRVKRLEQGPSRAIPKLALKKS